MSGVKRSIYAALVILLLAIVGGYWGYSTYAYLRAQAENGVSKMEKAMEPMRSLGALSDVPRILDTLNLEGMNQDLAEAEVNFRELQKALHRWQWLARLGGWLPRIGPQLKAAPALVEVAIGVSVAGQDIYGGLGPCQGLLDSRASDWEALADKVISEPFIDCLRGRRPYLERARRELSQIAEGLAGIDISSLPQGFVAPLSEMDAQLPRLKSLLDVGVVMPELLAGVSHLREAATMMASHQDSRWELMSPTDLARANGALVEAERQLQAARAGLAGSDFSVWGGEGASTMGQMLVSVPRYLDVAIEFCIIGQELYSGFLPLLEAMEELGNSAVPLSGAALNARIEASLDIGRAHLVDARERIPVVIGGMGDIDWSVLPDGLANAQSSVDALLLSLQSLLDALLTSPEPR